MGGWVGRGVYVYYCRTYYKAEEWVDRLAESEDKGGYMFSSLVKLKKNE